MEMLKDLSDPSYTARFQRFCGVYYEDNSDDENTCTREGESENHSNITTREVTDNNNTLYQEKNDNKCIKRSLNSTQFHQQFTKISNNEGELNNTNGEILRENEMNIVIKHKFLHLFFASASSLGNEAFYLMFYPFCLWNVDALLIRQVALVWCICMYVGQALKDYIRWPRPSAPPVVKLESVYLQEFAMPSTHAISAAAIPFMFLWVIQQRYEVK